MKEAYVIPRIEVRGILLEDIIALDSYRITISGTANYADYDEDYIELTTKAGRDIVVF